MDFFERLPWFGKSRARWGLLLGAVLNPKTNSVVGRSVILILWKKRPRRAQHSQSRGGGLAQFVLGRRSQKKNRDRWMIRSTELRPVHQRRIMG